MDFSQAISTNTGQTLVIFEGSYGYSAKQRNNAFIDYETLSLSLGSFFSTFIFYTSVHYVRLDEHKLFLKALDPTWRIKVVPGNFANEAQYIRRELQAGRADLYDHLVLFSLASFPELTELRASGKTITRCIFAEDDSSMLASDVDDVLHIQDIPGVYFDLGAVR